MEATKTEQVVPSGVSSREASETKSPTSPSKRTESTSSQSGGAIPKTKSRSGGVKLGSFRLGGRKKSNPGGDFSQEVKEEKRYTKFRKGKTNDKPEADHTEDSAAESTPSPATKQSMPSMASTLVRKLSIGKYKGGKNLKSPETPSSQEDCYITASPASSAATGGRPSLEGTASITTPTEDVASPIDQSTADIKVNKTETRISERSSGDTVAQAMSGIKDPSIQDISPELEPKAPEFVDVEGENKLAADSDAVNSGETFESDKSEEISPTKESDDDIFPTSFCKPGFIPKMSPVRNIEPPAGEDNITKHDLWFAKKFFDDLSPEHDPDKKPTTKDQILSITTPMLMRQRQEVDMYLKLMEPEAKNVDPYGLKRPDIPPGVDEAISLDVKEEEGASGPEHTRMPATSGPGFSQSLGSLAQQVGEKREHLYKILVIGELGTGKTSIIKRYVHQFFSQHYRATIGVDFALKVINWDANTIIRLQLWDIAGQERFGNMTRVYYKEAVGAFIVFDVTRAATFDAVVKWKQDLDTKVQLPDGTSIPCVLLANKCDQQKEGLVNNAAKMEEYCKERGFADWFETSAKENINIEDAAKCLVTKILQNDKMIHNSDSSKDLERFALDGKNQRDQKKSKTCSC